MEVLGDFTSQQLDPYKAHACAENTSCDVKIVKIGPPVEAQHDPKYKGKQQGRLRNQNMRHITCSPWPPTLSQHHVDLHVC